jgi:HAMP domain-containing protein
MTIWKCSDMNLLFKINIGLILVFGAGLAVTGELTNMVLQENAKREVIAHASLMMEAAMAARSYTTGEIKPLLGQLLSAKFLPQTVPSYAATQSFNKLHETQPDYSYKEATLNPTNPRDRVVEWEADVVQHLRDHPDQQQFIGERDTASGPSLYLARPIKIKDAACLSCHSTPSAAPATMLAQYGGSNGFGWKTNEIVGSQIVSVPLSVPLHQAEHAYRLIMGGMLATFAAILIVVNVLFYTLVLRPMGRIAVIANAISEGRSDAEQFSIHGNDEIATLGKAFNRLRLSLEKAMALLG